MHLYPILIQIESLIENFMCSMHWDHDSDNPTMFTQTSLNSESTVDSLKSIVDRISYIPT